jgi:uncharacterized protein involved in exopolysaccharide biosynthesis
MSNQGGAVRDLVTFAIRSRSKLAAAAVLGALIGLGLSFVLPRRYVATAAFIADNKSVSSMPAGLAGIASQFGVPMGLGAERSPEFYGDLVSSPGLLENLLGRSFAPAGDSAHAAPLIQLLKIKGKNSPVRIERGIAKLRPRVRSTVDSRTGVVTVTTDMPSSWLAAAVANQVVVEIDNFNRTIRRTRGRLHREFVETRVAHDSAALDAAEDGLRNFLEQNRRFDASPRKQFEENRLRRQITFDQDLYGTLRRELETARIEEVDDTPVLTVIYPAVEPQRVDFPRPLRMLVFGAIVAPLAMLGWMLLAEFVGKLPAASRPAEGGTGRAT